MEIRSPITGRRGVSLPFSDYCEPIVSDPSRNGILKEIISFGKKAKWRYIELRGGQHLLQDVLPYSSYYLHKLDLRASKEELHQSFRGSTMRNTRKARKEGVKVEISSSLQSIRAFYQLNCITRKDHGIPPQPLKFFLNIHRYIISQNKGFVALGFYKGEPIAGAIYFHFGPNAIFKYGASDKTYQHLRPNNLVMWEAIKHCIEKGLKSLDLGRTDIEHKGLLQFKNGWGTKMSLLHYYIYDFKKGEFVRDYVRNITDHRFIKNLQIPLLGSAGSMLYKHFG